MLDLNLDFLYQWPDSIKKPKYGWQLFKPLYSEKHVSDLLCLDSKTILQYGVWQEFLGEYISTERGKRIYKSGFNIFLNPTHILTFKRINKLARHIILPVDFEGINCFGIKTIKSNDGGCFYTFDIVVSSERCVKRINVRRVLFSVFEKLTFSLNTLGG